MDTPTFEDIKAIAPQWADACETLTVQIGRHRSLASQVLNERHPYHDLLRRLTAGRIANTPDEMAALYRMDYDSIRDLGIAGAQHYAMAGNQHQADRLLHLAFFNEETDEALAAAAPIYGTAELQDIAEQAAETIPNDINITPQMLLEPAMWVYLEDGLRVAFPNNPLLAGEEFLIRAFLIHTHAHTQPDYATVHVVAFADDGADLYPVDVFAIPFGTDHWWHRATEGGAAAAAQLVDLASEYADLSEDEVLAATEQAMASFADQERFVVALLLLTNQKDFASVEGHHRKVLRRLGHAQKTDRPVAPRIVVLRRRELSEAGRSVGVGTRRGRRWWRRGHWRQFRPNRYTWVTGHVCGPAEAEDPLVRNSYVAIN